MLLETETNPHDMSVLVTGSSKGIGKEIAEEFLEAGYCVAFNGRDSKALSDIMANKPMHKAVALQGDVSKVGDAKTIVEGVFNSFGRLDVLVCNVGNSRSVPPGEENRDEWDAMLALNFLSATNMVESARNLLAASRGCIICISSICGLEVVPNAPVTYSVAKAALNAYIHGIARPLGQQGIRINGIAPGNILFPGSIWDNKRNQEAAVVEKILFNEVSLSRFGSPQDVASLALWLASKKAGFVTGSIFVVDGGQVRS